MKDNNELNKTVQDTAHALDPDIKAKASLSLTPESTNGDKIHALRVAQNMSLAELSRRSGLTSRAIRYMEDNERVPSVEAIQKLSAALGVTTDFFMDDVTFEHELAAEQFYAEAKKQYGSRGIAQAKKIREQTNALFAGGDLSDEDRQAFIEEMEEIFFDAKEEAKKFTPKKYRKD